MSKGYIAIAQNNEEHDYLKLAYAMALSIKATQKENKICICVDENTKVKSQINIVKYLTILLTYHGMMMQER